MGFCPLWHSTQSLFMSYGYLIQSFDRTLKADMAILDFSRAFDI